MLLRLSDVLVKGMETADVVARGRGCVGVC